MKRILLLIALLYSMTITGQEQKIQYAKLKIYLDCNFCDMPYLIQEMDEIDFVRNPDDAQIYVLVRTQQTGSGGTTYQLEYTGQKEFEHISNTISFSVPSTSTSSEIREKMRNVLSAGLLTYRSEHRQNLWHENKEQEKLALAGKVVVKNDTVAEEEEKDAWNNWVFNLGVNAQMNGEESSKSTNYGFNFSSKQVTKKHKFYVRGEFNSDRSEYNTAFFDTVYIKRSKNLKISESINLNEHWSLGAFVEVGGSDYENKELYLSVKPAIEYSFFEYKEASKKQITVSYRIGRLYNDYNERTVFNKTTESRWEHSLNLGGRVIQKWGNISGEIEYKGMLDESSLYAFFFFTRASVRLFKGFSFNIDGTYEITRNLINIAGGGVSQDQLLLRQKQLQSGYNFYTSVGFTYSFGSLYNAIVNPRFGF